jgi:hypothetical protein
MTTRPLSILIASVVVAGCSSSSSSPPASSASADGGAEGGTTVMLAPPPAGQGIQYEMSTTIAASTEDERCKFVQTTEDMWVNHEQVVYTPGSHHFILWNTPYTSIPTVNNQMQTIDTSGVFDCVGGPAAAWNTSQFVGGAQSANAPPMLSDLPSDVALHIPAGSVLVMDLHVLNASAMQLNPTVLINLDTIPQSQVKQEAGIYFFYNPFIRVPAGGAPAHARMSCPVTSDVTLTTAQTHMHKWGLGGVSNLEDSSGTLMQQLYVSTVWTDPPVTQWASGMALQAGEQIDYECNYVNTGDTDIVQGLSAATNEMCVFAGAYYPRDTKFETCSTTGNWSDLGNAATYIGTGTTSCEATLQCIPGGEQSYPTDHGDALFGCMVDSCPAVAKELTAAWDCFESSGSANPMTACATQINACVAASCN